MLLKSIAKSGVFHKYLLSYSSVALLAYMTAAVVLILTAFNALDEQEVVTQNNQLSYIVEDLDAQISIFGNIAAGLRGDKKFIPAHLQRSPLNEIEIIQKLSKFSEYSPFDFDLYLLYPSSDVIYTMYAKTYFDVFSKYIVKSPDQQALHERITDAQYGMTAELWPEVADSIVLNYPIAMSGNKAHLLIFIRQGKLLSHYISIYGVREEEMGLYYDGALLTGSDVPLKDALTAGLASDGKFTIRLSRTHKSHAMNGYFAMSVKLLLLLGILVFGFIIFLAYSSYKPIRGILNGVIPHRADISDELMLIEEILQSSMRTSNISQKKLYDMAMIIDEQSAYIREQFLWKLLRGEIQENAIEILRSVGVRATEDMSFALVHITLGSVADVGIFIDAIKAQSNESTAIYPVQSQESEDIYLIVGISDENDAVYIMDILSAMKMDGLSFDSYLCGVAADLSSLHVLFEKTDSPPISETGPVINPADIELLDEMARTVEEGSIEDVLLISQQIADRIRFAYPLQLSQRAIIAEVNYRVFRMAQAAGITLDQEWLQEALSQKDAAMYFPHLKPKLLEINHIHRQGNCSEQEKSILSYIHENLGNYSLTLEQVASQFGMSEKRTSYTVRELTGFAYKEYIINMRMQMAAKLLREGGHSVAEAGQAVGYVNISYFIRSFKAYYGMTPAMYKVYPQH